jgi:hypothetical protein
MYRQTVQRQERERKHETKLSAVALVASAVTIAQANPPGGVHAVAGGSHRGAVARSAPAVHAPMRPGGVSSFRSRRCGHPAVDRFIQANASSFGMRSSPSSAYRQAFLFESRFVHAFRSIHGSNYPATQSCRAIRESQKPSCHSVWNQRNTGTQFRNGNNLAEREQYSECKQSPERKQFQKWKQPIAPRLAKTRFRSPIRELASRLEPQLRPLVEWPPMLLH